MISIKFMQYVYVRIHACVELLTLSQPLGGPARGPDPPSRARAAAPGQGDPGPGNKLVKLAYIEFIIVYINIIFKI